MTKNKAIEIIRYHKALVDRDKSGLLDKSLEYEAIDMAIKALEQQPSDDVMAIHTQGLDEGVRCAMCTNLMKSDRGCDGGCVVNEDMYKKVMDTIKNQMFSQPTSDDCVSRQAVVEYIKACGAELGHDCEKETVVEDILNIPPVTPTFPKGTTNGDIIKAMFPSAEVKEKNNGYEVYFGIGTASQYFNHQWWNALYKRGNENG